MVIMLATYAFVSCAYSCGLDCVEVVQDVFCLKDEFVRGLAEAAANNMGYTTVVDTWYDRNAGGYFAELA